jgi:hypothetical protein
LRHVQYQHQGSEEQSSAIFWDGKMNNSGGLILTLEGLDNVNTPEIVNEFETGVLELTIPVGVVSSSSIQIPLAERIKVENNKHSKQVKVHSINISASPIYAFISI